LIRVEGPQRPKQPASALYCHRLVSRILPACRVVVCCKMDDRSDPAGCPRPDLLECTCDAGVGSEVYLYRLDALDRVSGLSGVEADYRVPAKQALNDGLPQKAAAAGDQNERIGGRVHAHLSEWMRLVP